ncbi:hypothetical protein FEP76_05960 [Burkholderia multivorans]|nr:hypothetical protein [Burkholderia multivorans]
MRDQQRRGRIEARLQQHLTRRQVKHLVEIALELRDRHPRHLRELLQVQRLHVVILDVLDDVRELAVGRMRTFVRLQVARNAGEADDLARRIAQRLLAGQAPAGLTPRIQMQLELIGQLLARVDRRHVLLEIAAPETARKDFVGRLAEQVALVLVAAAQRQRAIDERVAAVGVLHEERDVGQRVEHRLEQAKVREHRAEIGVVGPIPQRIGQAVRRYGKRGRHPGIRETSRRWRRL